MLFKTADRWDISKPMMNACGTLIDVILDASVTLKPSEDVLEGKCIAIGIFLAFTVQPRRRSRAIEPIHKGHQDTLWVPTALIAQPFLRVYWQR